MKKFHDDISDYDPRNHRSDLPGVYSGFVLLALVMAGLFLL
ncbi:MAG: hypothetical protein O3C49_10670 [Proteobacteria bacterium]|nr:hypothetical protein [Pseudomonadota bacterium]MDA1324096.1 hypothetical protein [Pseudomonadota bacterium]